MANTKKISELPQATLPIVESSPVLVIQGGVTKQTEARDIANLALVNENSTITFTAPNGVEGQAVRVIVLTEDTSIAPDNSASNNYFINTTAVITLTATLSDSHTIGTQFTFTRDGIESMYVVSETNILNVAYSNTYEPEVSNVYFSDIGDTLTVTKITANVWHGVASGSGIIFND